SSRRRHTSSKRDWSSDVCSSDLHVHDLFEHPDLEMAVLAAGNGHRAVVAAGAVHAPVLVAELFKFPEPGVPVDVFAAFVMAAGAAHALGVKGNAGAGVRHRTLFAVTHSSLLLSGAPVPRAPPISLCLNIPHLPAARKGLRLSGDRSVSENIKTVAVGGHAPTTATPPGKFCGKLCARSFAPSARFGVKFCRRGYTRGNRRVRQLPCAAVASCAACRVPRHAVPAAFRRAFLVPPPMKGILCAWINT